MPHTERAVRVFIAEEQPLFLEGYQSMLGPSRGIEVAGMSLSTDSDTLVAAASSLNPDVMFIGTRSLTTALVANLRELRRHAPNTGLVLLSFAYDARAVGVLREFSKHTVAGCAYLLKRTVNTVEQLAEVILAVAEGRIIIDHSVLDELNTITDPRVEQLKPLSRREMEVLGWMARGYRNKPIAQILHVELKTVERHINNIYAKLGDCADAKHPRVEAIAMFQTAVGYRPLDGPGEETDPLDDRPYPPKRSSPMFPADNGKHQADEGQEKLGGHRQAMTTGPATVSRKSPAGQA